MKDYIVMVQDLLAGRNEEFDAADRKRVRLKASRLPNVL